MGHTQPIPKKTGEIFICRDFKVTLNHILSAEQYPLAHIDNLFAGRRKGKKFSKIDLNQDYLQMHWMYWTETAVLD